MRASVGGIIYANYDLSRKKVLHAEIPLVDFRVARFACVQAVVIRQSPHRERTISTSLRFGQAGTRRKRIVERSELRLEIVFGEANGAAVSKCRSWKLKIRCDVQAIVNAGATANYSIRCEGICKADARCKIIAIRGNAAMTGTGELSCAKKAGIGTQNTRYIDGHHDSAVSLEITELDIVLALGVRRAPFIAQAKVQSQLGIDFPVVLKIKRSFLGLVRNGRIDCIKGIRVAITQQKTCERITLVRISATHDLFRDAR